MELKDKLKDLGLKYGEEMLKDVVKEILRPLVVEKIQESENKLDDILLPFLDQIEAAILEMADKIHEPEAAPEA